MEGLRNSLSLETLLNGPHTAESTCTASPQKLLAEADVIYAVEPDEQREILVLGRERLRQIADSEIPEGARVLRVDIGHEPKRLQQFLKLIVKSRGYHDYRESA